MPARRTLAQNPPAVTFESMMNGFFGDKNGLVSLGEYDVVFAPKGKVRTLKRTVLGFKPAADFIVPRVLKVQSTGYDFVKATWIVSK